MTRIIAAVAVAFATAACSPSPHSAAYFEAHHDEAAKVVADCTRGAHRGQECVNAQTAEMKAARRDRMAGYKQGF